MKQLRNATFRDAQAIDRMIAAMPPLARDLHSWVNQADFHVALVDGDELLGFAARTKHRAHPRRELAAVYGAEPDALYDAVRGRKPLKLRVPADDHGALAMAHAHGFTERIRSATYRVPAYVLTGESAYEVTPVFDATRELLDAIAVLYADTHRWDPPAPYTRRYVRQTMVDGAQHMAFVRDASGAPIGVGAALVSGDASVGADIALVGPLDQAHPDAAGITHALLAHLASFYALGDAPLWFEIDTGEGTNAALAEIVTTHAAAEDEVVVLTSD